MRRIYSLAWNFLNTILFDFINEKKNKDEHQNNPKSLLFILGIKSKTFNSNALLFCSSGSCRKRRILPKGLFKTKVRQFCVYPLLSTSLLVLRALHK
jgi:hypothetical protein